MTTPVTDSATALFDKWAVGGQAEEMESEHTGPVKAALLEMGIEQGERILDLGCGNGWVTRRLAQLTGAPTVGVDGASSMIERATGLSKGLDNVSFQHARFENLPFEDGTFDRVFSIASEYWPDWQSKVSFKEAGTLWICAQNPVK